MKYRATIFDLDGTLVDTLVDLAAAGNHVLGQFDRPALPVERYRTLVGRGLGHLIGQMLGEDPAHEDPACDVSRGIRLFEEYYAGHMYDNTCAYPGIEQMLTELSRRGVRSAVLSNKPNGPTVDMVERLLGKHAFALVRGHRENAPLKPDPTVAREMIGELELEAWQCAYVGDTNVDMGTGKGAGMFTVGVSWGFREEAELRDNGADAIIHHPGELIGLLESPRLTA